MNKILEIHGMYMDLRWQICFVLTVSIEDDGDLVCQAGARWEDINQTLKEKGIPLFFPVNTIVLHQPEVLLSCFVPAWSGSRGRKFLVSSCTNTTNLSRLRPLVEWLGQVALEVGTYHDPSHCFLYISSKCRTIRYCEGGMVPELGRCTLIYSMHWTWLMVHPDCGTPEWKSHQNPPTCSKVICGLRHHKVVHWRWGYSRDCDRR